MEEDFPFETSMNGFLHSNCTSPEQEYILIQSREQYILLQVQPKVFPYRTACFGRINTLSSFAAGQLVVSQTPRERRLVKWWRCCCRPFRLLVELAAKYTPPLIVSKYTPAPGLCNLNAGNHSSICVSARDAPVDPVLVAGDCGGVPGSSDPVSTAARRGDGSHSDDGGYERMISIRKPSTSTFICRLNSSGVCWYSGITMFL